jgi:hypothetical protein
MFPWFWVWAPHLELPLSGNVMQDIDPVFSAFFKGIKPTAGNARIEERAVNVASYGRQLGLLTDLLIEVAERSLPAQGASDATLGELRRIRGEIEQIKQEEYELEVNAVAGRVKAIRARGGPAAARLARQLAAPAR